MKEKIFKLFGETKTMSEWIKTYPFLWGKDFIGYGFEEVLAPPPVKENYIVRVIEQTGFSFYHNSYDLNVRISHKVAEDKFPAIKLLLERFLNNEFRVHADMTWSIHSENQKTFTEKDTEALNEDTVVGETWDKETIVPLLTALVSETWGATTFGQAQDYYNNFLEKRGLMPPLPVPEKTDTVVEDKADITNEGLGKLMMAFHEHYKKEVDAIKQEYFTAGRQCRGGITYLFKYETCEDYKNSLTAEEKISREKASSR